MLFLLQPLNLRKGVSYSLSDQLRVFVLTGGKFLIRNPSKITSLFILIRETIGELDPNENKLKFAQENSDSTLVSVELPVSFLTNRIRKSRVFHFPGVLWLDV